MMAKYIHTHTYIHTYIHTFISITNNIKICYDEGNSNDFDEENSEEKIQMKKIKYITLFLEKARKT